MPPGDKPDQKTIDDDAELDAWHKRYMRDVARKMAEMKRGHNRQPHSDGWVMPMVGEDT